ncbi:hypothetical protein G6F56_007030 [Rhizopus delemar]|nr:hypothetical protein G6F56_007030 [Rhizopus delemar]
MADMTKKMGPMKHYSCRSTERTMKSFTSNICSTTRPGVNSSNILFDRANSNQYGIQEITNGNGEPSSTTNATTFLELPNDEGTFPQLWDSIQNHAALVMHHLTTSADNFVLFEAGRNGRISKCWFVGEAYTCFEHLYNNERRFLAVVNVMQKHEFGYYNIPMVTEDPHRQHFAVLNVGDVLHGVGLFQRIGNPYKYNFAWPYTDYQDKIGHRHPG